MIRSPYGTAIVASLLAACQAAGPERQSDRAPAGSLEAEVVRSHDEGPPGADPGTCWGHDVTPAVIETVTDQRIMNAQVGGDAGDAPVYRTETRQSILREREEIWFRTPCADELNAEMIETLQRALNARGYYSGQITGRMDTPTRRAIRAYQRPLGLDSGLLSLSAARQLGVVAYDFRSG